MSWIWIIVTGNCMEVVDRGWKLWQLPVRAGTDGAISSTDVRLFGQCALGLCFWMHLAIHSNRESTGFIVITNRVCSGTIEGSLNLNTSINMRPAGTLCLLTMYYYDHNLFIGSFSGSFVLWRIVSPWNCS